MHSMLVWMMHTPDTLRPRTGTTGEGISRFFQEKPVGFYAPRNSLIFRASEGARRAPGSGTGCRLSGFCAFSKAAKVHGFFPIKTGILRKNRF